METTRKKTFITGIPAWALSLMTAILSFFLVFIIAALLDLSGLVDETVAETVSYIFLVLVIVAACFLICRKDPGSIWYAPVICNAVGIIAAIIEPSFWVTEMWIIFGSCWLLSLTGALMGARTGRRRIT